MHSSFKWPSHPRRCPLGMPPPASSSTTAPPKPPQRQAVPACCVPSHPSAVGHVVRLVVHKAEKVDIDVGNTRVPHVSALEYVGRWNRDHRESPSSLVASFDVHDMHFK